MIAADVAEAGFASPLVPVRTLDVVIPVYNEEVDLEPSARRLLAHLSDLPFTFQVTIADNASTDGTALVARRLAHENPDVVVVSLALKGRGRALKQVWSQSPSPVLVYMDVDLSTDLNALLPLVAPLLSRHSEIAIGTRLTRHSRVERGAKREIISRGYNLLLRGTLRARFSDAQCGFKAMRREVAQQLLPLVKDDEWFFDTELLVLAERAGLRIHEVAVDWVDDPDSRVDVWRTATDDLRGIGRLGWSLLRGQVPLSELQRTVGRTRRDGALGRLGAQSAIFVLIGIASTMVYAGLFLGLRTSMPAQSANAAALVLTAVANTAANRRLTFGISGPAKRWRHQAQGLLVLGGGLIATSLALWAVKRAAGPGHPVVELVVLTAVNLGVTILRFVAMRTWMFRSPPDREAAGPGVPTPAAGLAVASPVETYPAPSGAGPAPFAHDQA